MNTKEETEALIEASLKQVECYTGDPRLDDCFKADILNAFFAGSQFQKEWAAKQESNKPKLTVWYGSMPETNGKTNWTAILHNGDFASGITLDRSEYPDRVRYEADRARWLIGELPEEPFILDYDADKHSGYVAPPTTAKDNK